LFEEKLGFHTGTQLAKSLADGRRGVDGFLVENFG
jgi:hypothetical protein